MFSGKNVPKSTRQRTDNFIGQNVPKSARRNKESASLFLSFINQVISLQFLSFLDNLFRPILKTKQ